MHRNQQIAKIYGGFTQNIFFVQNLFCTDNFECFTTMDFYSASYAIFYPRHIFNNKHTFLKAFNLGPNYLYSNKLLTINLATLSGHIVTSF